MHYLPFVKQDRFRNQYRTLLILVALCLSTFKSAYSQPGWQDLTRYYYYVVLKPDGQPISFQLDKSYQLIVAGVRYQIPEIPFQTGYQPNHGTRDFVHDVRINDFATQIPIAGYGRAPVEIQIVHGRDTMHLNQTTSRGYRPVNPTAGLFQQIRFLPGYFHFPYWAVSVFDCLPKTEGKVRILNAGQEHFRVSRTQYQALVTTYQPDEMRQLLEAQVLSNFSRGYYTHTETIARASVRQNMKPYDRPLWTGDIFPTEDADLFTGLVIYNFDTLNCSSSKSVFARYDRRANQLDYWMPDPDPRRFFVDQLRRDSFGNRLYLNVGLREGAETGETDCNSSYPYRTGFFQSPDNGRTWVPSAGISGLYQQQALRELTFLSNGYALGFNLRTANEGTYNAQPQGVYYLLKDFQPVDSFVTPGIVAYEPDWRKQNVFANADSLTLGLWGHETAYHPDDHLTRLYLVKRGDRYVFKTRVETLPSIYPPADRPVTQQYRNFVVEAGNRLVFRNGRGALSLPLPLVANQQERGFFALENGEEIYLFCQTPTSVLLLISFNGGTDWLLYPKALSATGDYALLRLDGTGVLSFFDRRQLAIISHWFQPLKN